MAWLLFPVRKFYCAGGDNADFDRPWVGHRYNGCAQSQQRSESVRNVRCQKYRMELSSDTQYERVRSLDSLKSNMALVDRCRTTPTLRLDGQYQRLGK